MDPPELASEPAPCYTRRGRIEPPENTDESFDDVIQLYFASPNGLQMKVCFKWDLQVGLTT
jgi:hypothetical protein